MSWLRFAGMVLDGRGAFRGVRRGGSGPLAVLVIAVCVLAWSCGLAQAKLVHPFVSSFGSFSNVQGVAVESGSGTVYVYDGGAGSVYKFDASGNPVNFTATGTNAIGAGVDFGQDEVEIAVDNSAGPAKGDIYVAHADGSVEIFSAAGEKLGELTEEAGHPWGEACGVAVDASGAVYVGLYASYVNKYVPSSNPVTNTDYVSSLEGLSGLCNVAADSAGDAYSVQWSAGPVTRYEPGQFGSPFPSGSVVDEAGSTLAVDPASDEIYVDERNRIAQYGSHGEPFKKPVVSFASTGSGAIGESFGIAVSAFNGEVYVSDGKGAISVFGPGESVHSAPTIEEQYVSDVAGTSATLGAALNPNGEATTYRFEYGTSMSYGSSTSPADAGSSESAVTAQAHLQGLTANTVYHYRLVATSEGGTVEGPDQTFTTQTVGGELELLDGRQWELVSPADKHGAKIQPIEEVGVIQAARDGHALTYVANAPIEPEPEGYDNKVQVLSTRGPEGWSSKGIATPHSSVTGLDVGVGWEYRFFSEDLGLGLVEPRGEFIALSPEATERTAYVRDNPECEVSIATCYTPLLTRADVRAGAKFGTGVGFGGFPGARFVGATADLRHVILQGEMSEPLTDTPGDNGRDLYEWSSGKLEVASVLPEGEGGTPTHAVLGDSPNTRNAISSDGSRVFWQESSHLYMRDMVKGETVRIGSKAARFEIASVDGSRVFFVSEGGALEECDVVEVAGKLACDITQLAPSFLRGVAGTSDDGSYVYFASDAQLAPGAIAGECDITAATPPSALCNLYGEHYDGSAWERPTLIAVISDQDLKDVSPLAKATTSRVSSSGRRFVFMSQLDLTGYDTHDVVSGQSDEEVYLYDAVSGRLSCVSCNPSGARPTGSMYGKGVYGTLLGGGDRVFAPTTWLAANVPGWVQFNDEAGAHQPNYLSEEGRVFFNSGDALVPQDVNGTWDVYEYEPPGVGSCTSTSATFSASASGCVDLVSAGSSADQSAFMDASESGDDVFLLTSSRLSSQDFDTSYDIYDARVCSAGAPCTAPVARPPACSTGDSCKPAASPQPSVFGAPASATFAGIGNVSETSARPAPRSLSRAQRLKRALRACHRKKDRHKRVACERKARRRYRAKKATGGSR